MSQFKSSIERNSTNEANVSLRTVTFDVYINGVYHTTFKEYDDAEKYVENNNNPDKYMDVLRKIKF